MLTAAGLAVRALALPNNQDPDDFIRDRGADAFKRLLEEAPDFITFYAAMNTDRTRAIEGKTDVAHEIFEILRSIDDELRVDEYLKHTAKVLQLREWACREAYRKFTGKAAKQWKRPESQTEQIPEFSRDDCDFIQALLNEDALRETAKAGLANVSLPESPLAQVLVKLFEKGEDALRRDLENEAAHKLYTAAANGEELDSAYAKELVEKQIKRLGREALRARALRIQRDIQETEQENDSTRLPALLSEKVRIEQQMQALGAT